MARWNSQRFLVAGELAGIDTAILQNAVLVAQRNLEATPPTPPILTLGHLGHQTGLSVQYLRALVSRNAEKTYRQFQIRKRPVPGQPPRFRYIAIPEPRLMALQRWIASSILNNARCHQAAVAYVPGSKIVLAAQRHKNAKWLVKVDIRDFFESITEIDVYRVFLERGYQPLTALELARICTRRRERQHEHAAAQPDRLKAKVRTSGVYDYYSYIMGSLPQGAPTSPMLANLAVRPLDEALQTLADKFGMRYTRYADDLTFSTTKKTYGRKKCIQLIGQIYSLLGSHGLNPNTAKTVIAPPGARKVVLGLLVDDKRPKLSRDFRSMMRMHLHYLLREDVGPIAHAKQRGFSSVEGLRQHLLGLISYAGQVDTAYAASCRFQLNGIVWPAVEAAIGIELGTNPM